MDAIQNMLSRRSIRGYKPDMVPQEIIDKILEAGTYAPTGRGMQSPIILAVTNKELRDRLSVMNAKFMWKDATFDPFYGAPVVLIVLANKERPTYLYDGSLVMANLMLAASSLGVGSCWIHRARQEFDSEQGKELLKKWGLPETLRGVGHCILGYPAENAYAKPRSPRKDGYIVKI